MGRKAERSNLAAQIKASSETTERLSQELAAAQKKLESAQREVKSMQLVKRSVPVVQPAELQAALSVIQQARQAVCTLSRECSEGKGGKVNFDEVHDLLFEAFSRLQPSSKGP